ncbi:transcription initiation factor IIB family protein [Halobacteriales archaeon Cl-PHB]
MASEHVFTEVNSGEEQSEQDAVDAAVRTCPACDTRVIADDLEWYCPDCGLVTKVDALSREPSPSVHGPSRRSGPLEWALEPTSLFRVDNGLGTRLDLGTDGRGNPLSTERRKELGRQRKYHRRLAKRKRRLGDALRDVENISTNADLPRWVAGDAARMLRLAFDERLAGGRMAWESLAAGAVLLAASASPFEREVEAVVHYAKTSEERACAAARKIRTECGVVEKVPPARDCVLDDVFTNLDDVLRLQTILTYRRIGALLLEVADTEPVGPGTSRATVAGAAAYVADRLTDGKSLTQAQVVDATDPVCTTSKHRIKRYACELHDAYRERYGMVAPMTVLARRASEGLGQ